MLWHVPADFAHFRSETLDCPVIMGRASWESLGGALPQRPNIVISSNPDYDAPGAQVVTTLEAAVDLGRALATASGASTVWITGGGRVYAEAMDLVDELVVTDLDLDAVTGGYRGHVVRAPEIDPAVWVEDPARTDADWRPVSGDARWRVTTWVRR
jgi:Dihydrofolate reductase